MTLLLPLALASALAGAPPGEEDGVGLPYRSLTFGGLESGDANLSAEVGWLRTGLRADVGVVEGLSFSARVDTFLLHDLLRGQNGGYLGLRYSLPGEGTLRFAAGAEGGGYFVGRGASSDRVLVLRAEAALGAAFDFGTLGVRAALLGLRGGDLDTDVWRADGEVGVLYELQLRRLLLGAEVFAWFHSPFSTLAQWRIRAGWAF